MKKRYNIIWVLIIIFSACYNDNEFIHNNLYPISESGSITFLQDLEGVSVLIFKENDEEFKYVRSIDSGWSTDGKMSTRLMFGNYRFLFIKSSGENTSFYSNSFNTAGASFDDMKIITRADFENENYVLPVDEVWLSETEQQAKTIYAIVDETTVYNRLTRAVSKIMIHLKRVSIENGEIIEYPFSEGSNIAENIKEIRLDINGVGEAVNIKGGIGFTKTKVTLQEAIEITEDGFATFEGPFVFPLSTPELSTVNISIIPYTNDISEQMNTSVNGLLERNKKLEITLLITNTDQLIDIIVDTNPITEKSDGDSGIWE